MTLFLENSFSINNYISISTRIKKIDLYFLYFLPIDHFKNLDKHYKVLPHTHSNIVMREIKYKILYFDIINIIDFQEKFDFRVNIHFAKSLYHIFFACSVLQRNHISFTPTQVPFVMNGDNSVNNNNYDSLPLLNDFSNSFYFPSIRPHNLKLYFFPSLLHNPYISIDVFIITYLIHHPIDCMCDKVMEHILDLFLHDREKIDRNTISHHLEYFYNYNSNQIIQYLFQFKHTWTYYSICYFFMEHFANLLANFSLYDLFHSYIHSSFKERSSKLLQELHDILFVKTLIR